MELGRDTERLAYFGQRTVGADDQPRRDIDRFPVTCCLQADHPRAIEPEAGKGRVVPERAGILLFQRIEDGMVRHIRQRHQGAIIRSRQLAIIHRTEPFTARTAKVESTDRPDCMGGELIQ